MLKKIFTSIFILALSITGLVGNTATALAVGPTCPQLSIGDEIKVNETNKPAIYVLDKDMHPRYFADGDIYKTYKETYKDFKLIDQRCLESLGTPGGYPSSINYRPGSQVVRSPFDDKLYVVLPGNALAPITDSVAKQLYGSNYKVVTINPNQWSQYVCKKADTVTKVHPGMTVKTSNSATVYYIDSQNIKHEVTASGMNQNFIISKFVMTVPENLLQGFTSGDLINGGVWYLTDRTGSGIGCGGGVTPPPNTDDKTAPTVSITQPTTGGTVSGNMTFSADAQDNNGGSGVDYVKFFVDNQEVGRDSNAPYSISWDTKGKSNQAIITLSVQAVDKAGNASGMVGGVSVKVDNSVSTGTTIEFTAPRNGDTIKDWVDLTVKLNNIQGGGIQDPGVRFYVKKPGTQTYSYINSTNVSPYTIQWDSKTVANGQVSFKAEVTDKTNTNSETTINVTVANGDPTVAFVGVAPQEGTITALKVGFEKTDRHVGKFQIANPNPYPITVTSIAFTDTGKKAADNYVYDLWSMYNADSNNPDNWQSSKSLNPNLSFDNLANGGVVIPQNQSASINFIVRINNFKSIGAAQAGDLFTLSVVPDQLKFKVKESDAGHDLNGNGNKTDELTFSFKGTAKLGTVIVPNP